MRITPLHVLGMGAGILLAYSAVKDRNPLETIKAALSGSALPEAGSWAPAGYGELFSAPNTTQSVPVSYTNVGAAWPTTSRDLGPLFGESYPGDPWIAGHDGVDIDGECGDPIWSPVNGKVTSAGYAGAYGNRVIVKAYGARDTEFWLCHLAAVSIRPGSTVAQGTRLGTMGETGNAHGCHLHLVCEMNGTKVDPLPLIQGGSGRI